MIIFDLDGTLANCEHRRHFVDPRKTGYECVSHSPSCIDHIDETKQRWILPGVNKQWKPDWDAFHEACDKDALIQPVATMWNNYEVEIALGRADIQIWSGRCGSVREKTIRWLINHLYGSDIDWWNEILKMRPIGDYTPDDQLKERWLDAALAQGKAIDFVFDDRPKVVRMWQHRGIFVFNCNQKEGEF